MNEKLKRYLIFLIGLFINALGVSFITKANLGTSPISSIPYVLSLKFPFSLGEFTIAFSIFLILLQLLILRKKFRAEHWLQIPVSILFGYFIDLTMALLFWLNPGSYLLEILYLLIGCVILGFGVYLEVLADVVMLPGESFVRAIVLTWNRNFGNTKICFDASMTIIAGVLSVIFFHRLQGVREGTIVAALLVGFLARVFGRKLAFLKPLLFPQTSSESKQHSEQNSIHVIAIGRQYGCLGHEIGKKLAEQLGWNFYDGELIRMIAGTTGYSPAFIQSREESMSNSLLYDLVNQMYAYTPSREAPKDKIFEAESKTIRHLAQTENCVIIGRCSDYILKDSPNCLHVFLHADRKLRLANIQERRHVEEKEAMTLLKSEDRRRADNYHYYTRQAWGAAQNYDLCLDTGIGAEAVTELILETLKHKFSYLGKPLR